MTALSTQCTQCVPRSHDHGFSLRPQNLRAATPSSARHQFPRKSSQRGGWHLVQKLLAPRQRVGSKSRASRERLHVEGHDVRLQSRSAGVDGVLGAEAPAFVGTSDACRERGCEVGDADPVALGGRVAAVHLGQPGHVRLVHEQGQNGRHPAQLSHNGWPQRLSLLAGRRHESVAGLRDCKTFTSQKPSPGEMAQNDA